MLKKAVLSGVVAGGMLLASHSPAKANTQTWEYYWSDTSGTVALNWGYRGGDCHVRYGYAELGGFMPFATVFPCDQGTGVVGGLESGKKYAFQIHQDNGGWSNVTVGAAYSPTYAYAVPNAGGYAYMQPQVVAVGGPAYMYSYNNGWVQAYPAAYHGGYGMKYKKTGARYYRSQKAVKSTLAAKKKSTVAKKTVKYTTTSAKKLKTTRAPSRVY
jgi:hypothetical protein